jgi:hypothetical protein
VFVCEPVGEPDDEPPAWPPEDCPPCAPPPCCPPDAPPLLPWLPCDPPLLPDEELLDCEPGEPCEGIDAPVPPRPEELDEGMLEDCPPERPDEPLDPDDDPLEPLGIDEGEDGDGIDEEDWLGQPPIRNAETALTAVICVATTSSRLRA